MRGSLTKTQRLKINVTRLKKSNLLLREERDYLKKEVNDLKKENKELKLKLQDKELQRKTLQKKLYKKNKDEKEPKPLGKKKGECGYHRPTPADEDVTEDVKHIPNKCPFCHNHSLSPARQEIVKYQEDIIIIPEKIVKKHTIVKRWCSCCKEYVRSNKIPPEIENLERIGPNVTAYVLYARYRLRLPFNKIKQSLKDLHDFDISEGEISNKLEKARDIFKEDYEKVKQLIKISDKVYCDETGWRVKGKNFWIWVFVTDKGIRYAIEDTRGKGVAVNALGENEDRVLISDFYAAYKNLPGKNQYCWVHLLRDSKKTESVFHQELKEVYQETKEELTKEVKGRDYQAIYQKLKTISKKKYRKGSLITIRKLQKRINKNTKELLTCLKYKNVLPENNTAERTLRNSVVMRKIFGYSRSVSSAKVMEVNTSVIDTLLQQNPDKSFFEVVLPKIKKGFVEGV